MKKKILSIFFALVLLCSFSLVTATPAGADELPVGPTPNYTTIQAAIDAANDYDTIIVKAGTYIGDVNVYKPLTIISEEGYGETAIVGVSTGYTGAVVINSNDVVLGGQGQGFSITGVGQAGVYFIAGCDNVTVEENFITSADNKNALVTEGGQSNHTIVDNYFGGDAGQLAYVCGQASVSNPSTSVDFIENAFGGELTGPALGQEADDSDIIGNFFDVQTGWVGEGVGNAFLDLWGVNNNVTGNTFEGNAIGDCAYFLDNTGTSDIEQIWQDNTFPRGVLINRPGSSLLTVIYANIQGGVNKAQSDDILEAQVGVYQEAVLINKSLTLLGANAGVNPVTETRGLESVIQDATGPRAVTIVAHGVTVDGFEVNGGGTVWGGIVENTPVTGTTVENNIVYGFTGIGICSGAGSSGGSVLSNDVTDSHTGVYLSTGASDFLIEGNWLHGMVRPTDVWSDAGSGVTFEGNNTSVTVTKNTLDGNNYGLYVWSGYGDNYGGTVVSFNDITGNAIAGLQNTGGGTINARYNWWDDISGPYKNPDGNPSGLGDPVVGNVNFAPWLTRVYQTVLEDGIAYFGYPWVHVNTGWNLLSTPIALDPACDTWEEYVELGNGLAIDPEATTYYFDGEAQWYAQVLGTYQLRPCDAIIVKMLEPDIAAICYSPDMSIPTKDVVAGWNLVSLSADDEVYTDEALVSIEEVSGGLTGYAQVVSPPMNQPTWVYSGYEENEEMLKTKGYWVFMLNPGTLAGFMFTPQSLP